MILLLPNDLINENNFGKIYDLIDSACLGIDFPIVDENRDKRLRKRETLKRLEELRETIVLKKFKAKKYCQL